MEPDYKLLFEASPGLYLVLLPDLTIVAVSDAYANATMTKREEILGRDIFDVFPDNPDDNTADGVHNLRASFNAVLRNNAPHTMAVQKYDIRRPDGTFEERYWSPLNSPVTNAENEIVYLMHVVTDMTDFVHLQLQQKAKDVLAEGLLERLLIMEREIVTRSREIQKLNETLEQKVLERTAEIEKINKDLADYKYALDESCIVSMTDENGVIQHVNDNFCQVTRYSKDELIGQDHIILNSGCHPKELMRELWEVIESGKIWRGELKNMAKDGAWFWVDTTIVPFVNGHGKPYKYLAIRYDITERLRSHEAVRESEEKYRNFFENSLVALFTTDIKQLKVTSVNEVGAKMFGYTSQQHFLDNYDPFFHNVDLNDMDKRVEDLMQKGKLENRMAEFKRLDGSRFWANMFIQVNFEQNTWQTIMTDVTEQVHAHELLEAKVKERTLQLTKALEREKELNIIKSRFVTTASHEFRTPLTSILSSASLIAMYKNPDDEEKKLKHVNRITSAVKNLIEILNDFLSLEQLEKGIVAVDKSVFSLPGLIEDVMEEMDGIVTKKNQQIIFQHHGPVVISQSRKILKNIIFNLLTNASKYSGENKAIQVASSVVDGHVLINVRDNGIGIPDEDQKNLFTEFFRAGNAKNIQGTGLGLTIVKKYTELLDGKINFTSGLGEGTTFTVELPQQG